VLGEPAVSSVSNCVSGTDSGRFNVFRQVATRLRLRLNIPLPRKPLGDHPRPPAVSKSSREMLRLRERCYKT
jgi:hypothetical protein